MQMTSQERMQAALDRKPVDMLPISITPWGATVQRWVQEGHIAPEEDIAEHFGQDLRQAGWLNCVVDLDFQPVVIEETEETILHLDGNGAKLRRHKLHDSTPELIDFLVKVRKSWEEHARPRLFQFHRRRINPEWYRGDKQFASSRDR